MKTGSFTIGPQLRENFDDIELAFISFPADTSFSIDLGRGEYELVETQHSSTLKIYDANSGLMYLEVHRCD